MKYINKLQILIMTVGTLFVLNGCGGGSGGSSQPPSSTDTPIQDENNTEDIIVKMDDILQDYRVDLLKDEVYYFPANTPYHEEEKNIPIHQFDFIFAGRNPDTPPNGEINGVFIPGLYTHMILYIGKDSDGYAYGLEMTGNKDPNVHVEEDGTIYVDGQNYVYCLGKDFNKECPKTDFTWDVFHHSEHLWAKRLKPELRERVLAHKSDVLQLIKKDLEDVFPFQLPLKITFKGNFIDLIDDGRENGADCTDYIITLLETTTGVCMDNIYIDAKGLTDYFVNDPRGQQVFLAAEYNPFSNGDLYISDILKGIYSIRNNPPRQTQCLDKRKVVGVPIPTNVFNSPSVVEIETDE